MSHPTPSSEVSFDPSGSIFLPKTNYPDREFESWELQLLLGRGVAEGKSYEDIQQLHDELLIVRARFIGEKALDAL